MLTEGVKDPAIFKAIFLAGGPGSGKSFVVGQTGLQSLGFKLVNSDTVFERALKKAGMDASADSVMSDKGQKLRGQAKRITASRQQRYVDGRLGLVIDGTGKNFAKIEAQKRQLEKLGYDCQLILVNTDQKTASNRNQKRARSLPDETVGKMWSQVQNNMGKFQQLFGTGLIIVDNSNGSNIEKAILSAYRRVWKWSKTPPSKSAAKKWIARQNAVRGIREEAVEEGAMGGAAGAAIGAHVGGFSGAVKGAKIGSAVGDAAAVASAAYTAYKTGKTALKYGKKLHKAVTKKKVVKEDEEYDAKPGGHEWGTQKGTDYFKKLTPGETVPGVGTIKMTKPTITLKAFLAKKTKVMEAKDDPCWDSHKQVGTKKKGGKTVPNCVPKEEVKAEQDMTENWVTKPFSTIVFKKQYKDAAEILKDVIARKQKESPRANTLKHSVEYYAQRVAKQYRNVDARTLAKYYTEEFIAEEGPAAETKPEYRSDNAREAEIYWGGGTDDLDDEDIKVLEQQADHFDWEQAIELGLYDEDEIDYEDDDDINITEVLSVQGRMKRRFAAKRNKQKLKVARNMALRRGSSPDRLKKRATRGARGMVYKKMLRGRDKSKLPPAERGRIEQMVKRFQPLVSRLAVRMLPNMRKMEINRMKSRKGKKPSTSKKYKAAAPIAKKGSAPKKAKAFKVKKR